MNTIPSKPHSLPFVLLRNWDRRQLDQNARTVMNNSQSTISTAKLSPLPLIPSSLLLFFPLVGCWKSGPSKLKTPWLTTILSQIPNNNRGHTQHPLNNWYRGVQSNLSRKVITDCESALRWVGNGTSWNSESIKINARCTLQAKQLKTLSSQR